MNKLIPTSLALVIGMGACATATVRQTDLDAWIGQPIAALETHPFFLTIPVVKTIASDGTEIWNYVNGMNLNECSGGGLQSGMIDFAAYSKFSNCVARHAACNNIFYIRDGRVVQYVPVGTGGARCMTTEQLQPGFRGAVNLR